MSYQENGFERYPKEKERAGITKYLIETFYDHQEGEELPQESFLLSPEELAARKELMREIYKQPAIEQDAWESAGSEGEL